MTNIQIEMSEDEFDDQYPLLTNHFNPHAGWVIGGDRGCLFETHGPELEFVQQQDPRRVWTLVDGDDGDHYLISGFHFVNRIGYLVSTKVVPEGTDIEVRMPMQTDANAENGDHELSSVHPKGLLADIARERLGIPTLATRHRDALDFHNGAMWQVGAALRAAFAAGVRAAGANASPEGAPPAAPASAAAPTPLLIPKGTPLVPGKMYLRLYHGRTDPAQDMDDWGFDGPTFGPLSCYVHTYCSTFRIHGDGDTSELWLKTHDDMIQWEGCFYGDMQVFIARDNDRG